MKFYRYYFFFKMCFCGNVIILEKKDDKIEVIFKIKA